MNKKENKHKWENINPNADCDFEKCYKIAIQQIGQLKSTLQQLASSYKAQKEK